MWEGLARPPIRSAGVSSEPFFPTEPSTDDDDKGKHAIYYPRYQPVEQQEDVADPVAHTLSDLTGPQHHEEVGAQIRGKVWNESSV